MRISDWSSDVCSSDLRTRNSRRAGRASAARGIRRARRSPDARRPAGRGAYRGNPTSGDPDWPWPLERPSYSTGQGSGRSIGMAASVPTEPNRALQKVQGMNMRDRLTAKLTAAFAPTTLDVADESPRHAGQDRKSVESGTRVSVRVDHGGVRIIKKTN